MQRLCSLQTFPKVLMNLTQPRSNPKATIGWKTPDLSVEGSLPFPRLQMPPPCSDLAFRSVPPQTLPAQGRCVAHPPSTSPHPGIQSNIKHVLSRHTCLCGKAKEVPVFSPFVGLYQNRGLAKKSEKNARRPGPRPFLQTSLLGEHYEYL